MRLFQKPVTGGARILNMNYITRCRECYLRLWVDCRSGTGQLFSKLLLFPLEHTTQPDVPQIPTMTWTVSGSILPSSPGPQNPPVSPAASLFFFNCWLHTEIQRPQKRIKPQDRKSLGPQLCAAEFTQLLPSLANELCMSKSKHLLC